MTRSQPHGDGTGASGVAGGVEVPGVTNEAVSAPPARWVIWKHDCIRDGMGYDSPCKPRCQDPWQVDAPSGRSGETFATWAEAAAYVTEESRSA